jgi:flagellar hook-length control protein FliK
MRLDPPSLGTVRLEMAMDAGRVTVHIVAMSESARGLLSGNLDMLRFALEERGLAVERLTVESASRSNSNEGTRGDSEQNARDSKDNARQDASQGRSRGHREARQQRSAANEASHDFETHFGASKERSSK